MLFSNVSQLGTPTRPVDGLKKLADELKELVPQPKPAPVIRSLMSRLYIILRSW
ncbi:hypothetical protein D3C81_756070 [compost metagenome]